MEFGNLARRLGQMSAERSPVLLTAIGVTGALATAYLAGKAGFKSALILDDTAEEKRRQFFYERPELDDQSPRTFTPEAREAFEASKSLTLGEMFEATWKQYIPAAAVGALTVASIICANRIGTRRAAAMASAYAVAEKGFEEYRKKVAAKMGKPQEKEIREEVAKERVQTNRRNATNGSRKTVPSPDDKNCYDVYSDRRFFSTPNKIQEAVNLFNQKVNHDGFARLSDLYNLLDMNDIPWGDQVGWNNLLEINITSVITDDDTAFALVFVNQPTTEYMNFH